MLFERSFDAELMINHMPGSAGHDMTRGMVLVENNEVGVETDAYLSF